jgi:hypothetical protein
MVITVINKHWLRWLLETGCKDCFDTSANFGPGGYILHTLGFTPVA